MISSHFFLAFSCFLLTSLAADASTWRSRSIYQLLTDRFARTDGSTSSTCDTEDRVYCGGSWVGVINHLDYIQGMGFDAVWISPVTLNLPQNSGDGTSYHGYWQQDLYSVNNNFGTSSDLIALSSALHERDMFLMVDVVVNHNGFAGGENSVDYSVFYPFNQQSQYHTYCPITDYNNETQKEICWLGDNTVSLVDLATENEDVANGYHNWIESLVSNYSIDGLRMDTAMYVSPSFWPPFSQAAGVFLTGEVSIKFEVTPYFSSSIILTCLMRLMMVIQVTSAPGKMCLTQRLTIQCITPLYKHSSLQVAILAHLQTWSIQSRVLVRTLQS